MLFRSIGRLVRYDPPRSGEYPLSIRVDDGVAEGGEVSLFYDPMIAKLVTWAPTRAEAAAVQVEALDRFVIEGPGHNVDFLSAVMQHPRYLAGDLATGFIAEEWPEGFAGAPADDARMRIIAAVAAGIECTYRARAQAVPLLVPQSDWVVQMDSRAFAVTLGEGHAMVDGTRVEGHCDWEPGMGLAMASGNGAKLGLQVRRERPHWHISTRGRRYRALVLPAAVAQLAAHMLEKVPPDRSRLLTCPMPGLLVRLHVAAGDHVEPGQMLASVEAMKMENLLRATRGGMVARIAVAEGETLAQGAVILELE